MFRPARVRSFARLPGFPFPFFVMLRLILSRLWQGALVLLVVSALTFGLLAAAGGDALTGLRNDPLMDERVIENLRRVYGLDRPLHVRYARWLSRVARGDLGHSVTFHAPVSQILRPRLLNTLLLSALGLAFASVFSLALGAWAARREGWPARLCEAIVLLTATAPRTLLALAALAFAVRSSLFDAGPSSSSDAAWTWAAPARALLPALVLSVPVVARLLAQARDGLGAALREEFVRVARAKGLSERAVVLRHALRAALNPLVTVFGLSLGVLISGSVIVETVLGWPGLGQLSVAAVRGRDVPLLMGVVLITSTAVLAGNLLADILQRANDPRLRDEEARAAVAASNLSAA
ncbi:MAG TPA: ABC transporter permease [Pyrinomonadaceae bacterium]|nr:ABC transporter permease [Pyrinomonadaceae bacterium]